MMSTRFILLLVYYISYCETKLHEPSEVIKISETPIEIEAKLNDTIVINTQGIDFPRVKFWLTRPDGDGFRLKQTKNVHIKRYQVFDKTIYLEAYKNNPYVNITVKETPIETKAEKIINLIIKKVDENKDVRFERNNIGGNDIIIGPLNENHDGNWVFSRFYYDIVGNIVEVFQVISILVSGHLPQLFDTVTVNQFDNFRYSFLNPIWPLESCQLIPPREANHVSFSRDYMKNDFCGYIIFNVTKNYEGVWRIIANGRITYTTDIRLVVTDDTVKTTSLAPTTEFGAAWQEM